ncbi:hypothetical protein TraAM80_06666 [Trypanosoma rangeli]|uniref:Secreted protein n=1 Tax=Trypanosoma rangeli TaxID=5698 RepID=A0A422N976_TRYRA|nr:uncharacterized protein TraAM80_06666 [Trypanosoma rangeli]RNF02038.1 hypothetical protein TraAM80_06666 [Trypanosoma rangeli]|eukprot:RNF02038.1 hypothetical protein TraAM80_06666 [Trypanosoma rangeli]
MWLLLLSGGVFSSCHCGMCSSSEGHSEVFSGGGFVLYVPGRLLLHMLLSLPDASRAHTPWRVPWWLLLPTNHSFNALECGALAWLVVFDLRRYIYPISGFFCSVFGHGRVI